MWRRLIQGAHDRPVERSVRLLIGLVLFGASLGLLVRADLGLDPWDVFSQGVARRTGTTIGTVTIVSSVVVLLLWIPLRQRPGIGTVANAVLVGAVLDWTLLAVPQPRAMAVRVTFLVIAVLGAALATGLYLGAGWGPGPRDGLMTGLAARGVPLHLARGGIEVTVLVIGWILGGSVGIGTVVFALAIGPLVAFAVPRTAMGTAR